MHTLSFTAYGQHHGQEVPRWRKLAPLAAIVAGHALMFYLFNTGMLRQVAHAVMPNIVTISFVAASEPVKAAPPPPMPSGFTATAAISNILLEHAAPTYTQGHGHAKQQDKVRCQAIGVDLVESWP